MVSAILPLRTYQKQAIEETDKWLTASPENIRGAVVLPTGGGKTVVFSHKIKQYLDVHPDKRVLVLVDRDSICRQTVKSINDVAPDLSVGVVKARENETTADVIVASVQTLRNPKRMAQIRDVGLVIVDECDLASAPSYMTILTHFGCFDPKSGVKCVGFTATLYRTDGKVGLVWQDVTFTRPISWMIRKGFLIPPRGIAVEVPDLNLASVKKTKADFREGDLGEALADSLAPEKVAEAIVEHASDRKILAFFPTIASSYIFAKAIEEAGIPCEVIHGGLSQSEQDAILARHKRGTCVVNCMILTVGYDDPEVDCIVMGRPTKSKRLYVQIVGRGLRVDKSRPYEEQDCLLLDVVGANSTMDLRSIVDLSDKPIDPNEARKSRKTLTDLEDEFDAGEGVEEDEPNFWRGETVVKEFDPLGVQTRSKVWLKTKDGTYFVPAGTQAFVFIMEYPRPGRWSVAWISKDGSGLFRHGDSLDAKCACEPRCKAKSVAMTEHRDLDLEMAMSWAEDLALDFGASSLNTSGKDAPWRRKPPSERLIAMAAGYGIQVPVKSRDEITGTVLRYAWNAGEVSDRITRIQGEGRIDPVVKKVKEKK